MSILQTKDGSNTYVSPIYQEAFHSKHGALTESQHVFIQNGLLEVIPRVNDHLYIFEMGLGSGLNALLTAIHAAQHPNCPSIYYDALEKHPLPWNEAKGMEFCDHLSDPDNCREIYKRLHISKWETHQALTSNFSIRKLEADLLTSNLNEGKYHLIYYDAFGPRAQPELWSSEICDKLFYILQAGGVLTTYCAQGQFKRNLKNSGFEVEPLQGPPGKREMTRARKW